MEESSEISELRMCPPHNLTVQRRWRWQPEWDPRHSSSGRAEHQKQRHWAHKACHSEPWVKQGHESSQKWRPWSPCKKKWSSRGYCRTMKPSNKDASWDWPMSMKHDSCGHHHVRDNVWVDEGRWDHGNKDSRGYALASSGQPLKVGQVLKESKDLRRRVRGAEEKQQRCSRHSGP